MATHCLYSEQLSHALFLPQQLHIRDLMFVISWINGAGLFIFAVKWVEREKEREWSSESVFRSCFINWKCKECIQSSSLLESTLCCYMRSSLTLRNQKGFGCVTENSSRLINTVQYSHTILHWKKTYTVHQNFINWYNCKL